MKKEKENVRGKGLKKADDLGEVRLRNVYANANDMTTLFSF